MKKVMIAVGQLTGGGAERVATVWANDLADAGYDVSVLSYFPSDNEYPLRENVKVCRVAGSQAEYLSLTFIQKYTRIRSLLRSQKPAWIISFMSTMQVWIMLTSVALPIKRIETIRINPWRINIPGRLHRFLWKMCYTTSTSIILQSSDQASFFSKYQQKKSAVVPNPLSDVYFQSCKEHITSPPKRFIAAGRISEQKNYPMMIKAFANVCRKYPDLSLSIYGAGDDGYVEEIRRHIAAEGMSENIFLVGRANHMEYEYPKYDVFLMTSDYEGLPNALAEAMASRLVCISTDCKTGPRDLIDNGVNGFLVPVDDANMMQKRIESIMNTPIEELDMIASNARKKVLAYCSRQNSIERVCKLLR